MRPASIVEKLAVHAFVPLAGRFVAVNGLVSGTFCGTNGNSAGDFWTVLRNLATGSMPQPIESVGPMFPNANTTAQAYNTENEGENFSHNFGP
jgi:hypothetical protein